MDGLDEWDEENDVDECDECNESDEWDGLDGQVQRGQWYMRYEWDEARSVSWMSNICT